MTGRRWTCSIVWWIEYGRTARSDVRAQGSVEYPGPAPGEAKALTLDNEILLDNDVLECKWSMADGHLRPLFVIGQAVSRRVAAQERVFSTAPGRWANLEGIRPQDRAWAGDRQPAAGPQGPASGRARRRQTGPRDPGDTGRQSRGPVARRAARWLELRSPVRVPRRRRKPTWTFGRLSSCKTQGATPAGTLDGSPVTVADTYFFAFEHPLVQDSNARPDAPMQPAAEHAAEGGRRADVQFRHGRRSRGTASPGVPVLRRAGAGPALSALPPLQQLVRPRLRAGQDHWSRML